MTSFNDSYKAIDHLCHSAKIIHDPNEVSIYVFTKLKFKVWK